MPIRFQNYGSAVVDGADSILEVSEPFQPVEQKEAKSRIFVIVGIVIGFVVSAILIAASRSSSQSPSTTIGSTMKLTVLQRNGLTNVPADVSFFLFTLH